jgi:hypothetical protein
MARYDSYFALLFGGSLLTLAVIALGAILRSQPTLARPIVVIPVVAIGAAIIGASAEVLFGDGLLAAVRGAALAGVSGLLWGVAIWALIALVMKSRWWRKSSAGHPD